MVAMTQHPQRPRRRFAPRAVPAHGPPKIRPEAQPVMGDPLSVLEDPAIGYAEPETDLDTLWLKLPPELADFFNLGFRHGEDDCPEVLLRPLADEIAGPSYAFASLARVILTLCENVPCIAGADRGEAAQRQAG